MNTSISRLIQFGHLSPENHLRRFHFRSDPIRRLLRSLNLGPMARAQFKQFEAEFRLSLFTNQVRKNRQKCSLGLMTIRVPVVYRLMSRILRGMSVNGAAEILFQEVLHSRIGGSNKANLHTVVSWPMHISFADCPGRSLNTDESVGVNRASKVSVQGFILHSCCHYIHIVTQRIIVGKKLAGRLLDGREWNEFPQEQP